MKALFWILSKIGPLISAAGVICLIGFWVANDGLVPTIICSVVGAPLAYFGYKVGQVAWGYGVSPSTLWFMSESQIFNSVNGSGMTWAFRFFCIPFIVAGIIFAIIG